MFSVEIRINGSLIGHIYGVNNKCVKFDIYRYEYTFYDVETGTLTQGWVNHERSKGANTLIRIILDDIASKEE